MSRRILYATLMMSAALTGCSSIADKRSPDDTGSVTVHCNSSDVRWNACYDQAANVCGEKGYQIVDEGDSAFPTATTNIFDVPVIGGSMVIRCNR